jgi:Tat protein secretion system quality control protein TatD with DNase activity
MTQEQLRMQMLAGIITEGQYKAKLNEEEGTDILSFLKSNKQELLSKLTEKFEWDEDDAEMIGEYEIGIGADADGNEDAEIAGLGEAGLDFSFNPNKVKDTYGDASNFKLVIAGKPIYGISYNM